MWQKKTCGTATISYFDEDTDIEHEITFDWYYTKWFDDEQSGYEFDIIEIVPPIDKDLHDYVCDKVDWWELRNE